MSTLQEIEAEALKTVQRLKLQAEDPKNVNYIPFGFGPGNIGFVMDRSSAMRRNNVPVDLILSVLRSAFLKVRTAHTGADWGEFYEGNRDGAQWKDGIGYRPAGLDEIMIGARTLPALKQTLKAMEEELTMKIRVTAKSRPPVR
jgi:hypothetical protein